MPVHPSSASTPHMFTKLTMRCWKPETELHEVPTFTGVKTYPRGYVVQCVLDFFSGGTGGIATGLASNHDVEKGTRADSVLVFINNKKKDFFNLFITCILAP